MTIEEKARAYDEALEDMRVIYPNLRGDAKLAVEHAFPELAKSEDERIIKTLQGYVKNRNWPLNGPTQEEVLAWLEKQKEQKPTATIDGEPIPTENHSVDIPLAEWSEEDERKLQKCIKIVERWEEDYDIAYAPYSNTLKFLCSQSKKELSIEKAIQWLDDTFYFSDNSSGRGIDYEITTHDFDSLEEMYDSFRKAVIVDSEPFWKPTDEQIRTLDIVISDYRHACTKDSDKKAEILKPLLEQLEKL